jgi:FkbM family methyltransferase
MHFLQRIKQKMVLILAEHLMSQNRGKFPRLAVMTGDYVSLKSMLLGRFEDQQLSVLEKQVFPKIEQTSCLDIGANIGNHSVAFSKHFKKVYAFEPNPAAFDLLCINTKWHGAIEPIPLGASDKQFKAQATIPFGNEGAARISAQAGGSTGSNIAFECVRVDGYLSASQFADIGFIKLDVEGHELEALRGCKSIIEISHPVIAFELLRQDHARGKEIESLLKSWGYRHFYEVKSSLRAVQQLERRNYKMLIAAHQAFASGN